MKTSEENIDRWGKWMLLEHGPEATDPDIMLAEYLLNEDLFNKDKVYFGCGGDGLKKKYDDYDVCDLREGGNGVIIWDILLGLPYEDASIKEVRSKLTLGMLTYDQAGFIVREAARVLEVGCKFVVTFRNFKFLLERLDELDPKLFSRYIYGSGLYYGSRRRSCWDSGTVTSLAGKYNLKRVTANRRGMNTQMVFMKEDGKLKKFSPEPKVKFDTDGRMINNGGEFDSMKDSD